MNKHKVKHHRNSDTNTANRDHTRTTALERSVMNYWGLKLVLRAQPHPPKLMWYKHLVGCSVRMTVNELEGNMVDHGNASMKNDAVQ